MQTPTADPAAAERPEAIERVVEMATLHRKSQANQMNVLLRDSRLGRLSLHLVERAGLIDTIVRSDNARTGSLINDNMLQLVEALAGRGCTPRRGPSRAARAPTETRTLSSREVADSSGRSVRSIKLTGEPVHFEWR